MRSLRTFGILTALLLAALSLRPSRVASLNHPNRLASLPHYTLWLWDRSEDLHRLYLPDAAIAILDQTVRIDASAYSVPRHHGYQIPTGIPHIAVVRIEARGTPSLSLEPQTAQLILHSIETRPAALQIDFDATRSQRPFYTALLNDLHQRLPQGMPLSITALASWCSYDDWISALPVDEAVPMFFRMEPDRRNAPPDLPHFAIREPLCLSSAGLSTHEPWPPALGGKRIYLFPDRGWQQDLPLATASSLAQRMNP